MQVGFKINCARNESLGPPKLPYIPIPTITIGCLFDEVWHSARRPVRKRVQEDQRPRHHHARSQVELEPGTAFGLLVRLGTGSWRLQARRRMRYSQPKATVRTDTKASAAFVATARNSQGMRTNRNCPLASRKSPPASLLP